MTVRVVSRRPHVVRANAHLPSPPAALLPYLLTAKRHPGRPCGDLPGSVEATFPSSHHLNASSRGQN